MCPNSKYINPKSSHPPSYPYPYSQTLEHTGQGILSDSTSVFLLLHKRHEANSSICLILESSKFSSRQFFKTPKRSGTRDHPPPLIPSACQVSHGAGLDVATILSYKGQQGFRYFLRLCKPSWSGLGTLQCFAHRQEAWCCYESYFSDSSLAGAGE